MLDVDLERVRFASSTPSSPVRDVCREAFMASMENGLFTTAMVSPRGMRGKMLWFNVDKDLGALRTDDDERLEVPGSAFAAGLRPEGRCVGKVVEFRATLGTGGIAAEEIVFVPEVAPRRARRRRR
jgi:hypothetical protein